MRSHSTKMIMAAGTALALVQAAPALAQSAEDHGASGDIIVTARRVEERLQDVPISMTVFNQEQLSNRNVNNGADLAAYTPSLNANNNFGSSNTAFSIRGFFQEFGTQPSVGIYFNDVVAARGAANNIPVGDGAGPGSFFDLQNVQVLKGPQGTLFGRNTTGGAILLVPQKPTDRLEGYVEGSLGNYDMRRIQAVLNVPLGETARLRVGGDWQKRDGYLKNDTGVGPDRFADVDYVALRASLVADLTPNLENYMVVSYSRSNPIGDVQKLFVCDPANPFTGGFACAQLAREQARDADFYTVQSLMVAPRSTVTQWQIINTTTWDASDALTVKNIASYAQFTQFYRTPLFGADFWITGPADAIHFAVNNPVPGKNTSDQYTFTDEFRLQGNAADGKLTWQAGAYYEQSNPLTKLGGNFTPSFVRCLDAELLNCIKPLPFVGSTNLTANSTYFQNVGVYAQGTYSLTDQLKFTGGIRYTWDRVRSDSVLATYAINVIPPANPLSCGLPTAPFPACDSHYTNKSSAPTWLIGLDYNPTDDLLLYGKYTRGYRAGGVAPQAPATLALFEPEKVDTYEVGVKASFSGQVRGFFNLAAFYNDFSNQQLSLSLQPKNPLTTAFASSIANAGKSRIYGVEIDTSISPFEGFTLDGSYAYLNTKIQSVIPVVLDPSSPYSASFAFRVGDPLPLTPKHKFSITGTYVLPLDDSIGRLSVGATYTYTSSRLTNYANRNLANPALAQYSYLPSFDLLNLNLNWNGIAGSDFDLQLFATNVTKKEYYTNIPGSIPALGFDTAVVGAPRMFGARLKWRFGD